MKKIITFLALTGCIFFTACKKSDDPETPAYTCTTCKTTPDAVVANDASSKGIYKGVVIGSSGTIMFNIANSAAAITAVMVIDGTTVNLTTTVTWNAGQPYIADFTGTLNGTAFSIHFAVAGNGTVPSVTSTTIPGHLNASLNVVKETSLGLVECFEGTYHSTKPEDGVLNFILSRTLSTWSGTARPNGATSSGTAGSGSIVNNKLVDATQNNQSLGTLNGDNLSGTFTDNNGKTITTVAKRTL
jgi:hypothetical protein